MTDPLARFHQDERKLRAQLTQAQAAVQTAELGYAEELFSPDPNESRLTKLLAARKAGAEKIATTTSALAASEAIRLRAQAASSAAAFDRAGERRRELYQQAQGAQQVLKQQIEAIAESQRKLAEIELADSDAATEQHACNASGGLARQVASRMTGISLSLVSGNLSAELASAVHCLESAAEGR